jgi:hypothetical protein
MKQWWQKPIKKGSFTKAHAFILTLVIAVIVEILSSPVARIWFGLLIVGSVVIAVLLHMRTEKDGGL